MRLGLLGVAHVHADAYVGTVRATAGVELIGVADEDAGRSREFARRCQVRLFDDYDALLASRPDGVIVCAETARHRRLVELAARAGTPVLCEKPLAPTLADAKAMVDACDRAGVTLMTAFPMRFSAPLLEVKRALEDGRLGRIFCGVGTNQGQNPGRHRAWFVDHGLAGGGAVTDHTAHLVDALRWLLGREVVEVYAQTNAIMPSGGDVETAGLVALTFEGGVFATIDCSWSRPDSYPTWGGLALDLVGEGGVMGTDAFRQNLTLFPERSLKPRWLFWGSDADQGMIGEFVSAIRERRSPAVTGRDGYKAVEVVVAAYRSAQTGQPVRLS